MAAATVAAAEPNACIRGCCTSSAVPLRLPPSAFSLLSPIARGSESTVFDASLAGGRRVAGKKPLLTTADDLDRFHQQLQLLCEIDHPGLARFVAANARPPDYLLFFEFYEGGNLDRKLHVEEWAPSVHQALAIACELGLSF